ncbi:hypothetical protein PENTCL1PPCAC_29506, partial [Pristionchus entomophagus]
QSPISVIVWSINIASVLFSVFMGGQCLLSSNLALGRITTPSTEDESNESSSKKASQNTNTRRSALSKRIKKSRSAKAWLKAKKSMCSSSSSSRMSTKQTVDNWDEAPTVMASRIPLPERRLEECIETPMTEEEFILSMKNVIEFTIDSYRTPDKYPVSTDTRPNEIFNQLPQKAPDHPEKFDLVWKDFHEIIMKGCIQWQHPRFHAYFTCGRSYPDILAETLISAMGTVGFAWSANPAITELDNAMVNWMGRALGIPESFLFQGTDTCQSEGGGWLADTASDAIFCAIMAARHLKVEQEIAKLGLDMDEELLDESNKHASKMHNIRGEIISKLVAYGSYESHSSFEKACKIACVRCRHIEVYEEDDWGMRREEVEEEMEKDVQRGLIPFYLHVALGTTSTASSDHLAELTPLKEKFDVWVHVDAAYAGSAWVEEKHRNNKGIDKVDSINVNLHKFFLTSCSVTLFWTRHQRDYKEFFRINPAYLKNKNGANDLRDWGIQLTRRFKSLKVYMLLRVYGISGMRAYVNRIIGMTEYMESLMVKIPNIRKFGKTNYALFCVQYHEAGMSQEQVNLATCRLYEFINNSHKLVFTHSNVRGHDIIRVAVTLERTTKKDVEESVAIFIELLEEFKQTQAENHILPACDVYEPKRVYRFLSDDSAIDLTELA